MISFVVSHGEVSERFMELVLETSDSKEPRVRIPSSPPPAVSLAPAAVFCWRGSPCLSISSESFFSDVSNRPEKNPVWRSTQVGDEAPLLRA